MKLNSLAWKIGLSVFGAIIFFGFVTIWATYTYSIRIFSEEKKSEAIMVVTHGSKLLEEVLSQTDNLIKAISKDDVIIKNVEKFDQKNEIAVLSHLNNYNLKNRYSAIYLIGLDGVVLLSTDEAFVGQDYSFREYFIKAKNGEAYGDVNLGITSNKLGYYFSYPIKNEAEKIVGVAVIKMNSEIISQVLKDTLDKPMKDLMMIDKYGVVVSSDKGDRLYQSIGKLEQNEINKINLENKYGKMKIVGMQYEEVMKLVRDKTVGIKVVSVFDEEDNDEEELVIIPISNQDFYLMGEISMSEVLAEASEMAIIISLMVAISAMATIGLAGLFLVRLLKPISMLTQMAKEITAGNFNQVNPVVGGGELEILGTSMVNMSNELGDKYSDMEKLVAERTVKIENQNEILEKSKMAVMNILDDVEQAKGDLEKFKLAVEEASDHIVITDSEGIILYANKAVEKITGYKNIEVMGKKAGSKDLWGGLMDLDFYKKLWKTIKIDKKIFSGEVSNIRKNGEKYIAKASISPVLDQNGKVLFFVGIERDVTHEKEVDRMKTDFISLASHQLRTPLSAMRWFLEMLLAGDAGKLTKEQTEFVKNIEQANTKMIVLVNSLLNISRIESGRIVIDPILTDLKKLVDDELLELDKNIKDKNQKVTFLVDTKLPKINIDPKLITEVYKNLLTNAIKYSPKDGKIEINITHNKKEIISQITDNGIGIPKNSQKRIFERFYRAKNVVKTETEGTGLGLYLAKAIVESSGGKIWFESGENNGTTFWFSLPLEGMKKKTGEVEFSDIIKEK